MKPAPPVTRNRLPESCTWGLRTFRPLLADATNKRLMCGIAGTYETASAVGRGLEPAQAMAALIAHRGPDADGFLVRGRAALANRRLAIIDLTDAGRQPLYNEDGTIGLVY